MTDLKKKKSNAVERIQSPPALMMSLMPTFPISFLQWMARRSCLAPSKLILGHLIQQISLTESDICHIFQMKKWEHGKVR